MRTLEVRRHSLTKKGSSRDHGSVLSAEGIRRARRLGDALPSITYVLTGPDRRHIETAIAMGYPVDEVVDWPSGYVAGFVKHHEQWQWQRPYARYADLLRTNAAVRDVVDVHLTQWRRAVHQVEDGETALVVFSGGSIEPALVAAFSAGDHANWGPPLHHLDGASLSFNGDKCVDLTFRRE